MDLQGDRSWKDFATYIARRFIRLVVGHHVPSEVDHALERFATNVTRMLATLVHPLPVNRAVVFVP